MAGDWLKIECNLPEKPEVLAITVTMGWDDPDVTVGKLVRVWRWFDQHTIDGNAPGVTAALLDRLIGVTGLCAAMAKVGWLLITDAGLSLPNFDRHNGKTAKDRALTAKRVATHKAKAEGNANGNSSANAASVSGALPREEKRRKEQIPPIPPKGAKPPAIGLKAWMAETKAKGEKLIPDGDPVFAYAEGIGLPREFLHLAWVEFRDRYSAPEAKRYRDWRAVFRKAVRGNWLKLWWQDRDEWVLTTAGVQAQRTHNREAA